MYFPYKYNEKVTDFIVWSDGIAAIQNTENILEYALQNVITSYDRIKYKNFYMSEIFKNFH